MRKILLAICLVLVASPALGANWFAGPGDTDFNAVSDGTTSSVWNSNADGSSGTYLDWSTQPSNGDIFIANGATIAIDDNIGSGSVTVTLTTEGTDYGGTDGGGFKVAINLVEALTLYINCVASTTACLSITGSGSSGTELTIIGSATGGTANNSYGIGDSHTGTGAAVNFTGNLTGGSGIGASGYYSSGASGTINVNGPATITGGTVVSSARGFYKNSNSVASITGNCVGGSVGSGCENASATVTLTVTGNCSGGSGLGSGCYGAGASGITLNGNIENTTTGSGANGVIKWNPGTLGSDFRYIKVWSGSGTDYYYAVIPPIESNVKSGVDYGWDGSDHYTGTLSAGSGGGAWGF